MVDGEGLGVAIGDYDDESGGSEGGDVRTVVNEQ